MVYWPGVNKDIEDFISTCSVCKSYHTDQQKEPMTSHEIASRPWGKRGARNLNHPIPFPRHELTISGKGIVRGCFLFISAQVKLGFADNFNL